MKMKQQTKLFDEGPDNEYHWNKDIIKEEE